MLNCDKHITSSIRRENRRKTRTEKKEYILVQKYQILGQTKHIHFSKTETETTIMRKYFSINLETISLNISFEYSLFN